MTCEYKVDGNCEIASELAGQKIPVKEDACNACLKQKIPKQVNHVTSSIALSYLYRHNKEQYHKRRDELSVLIQKFQPDSPGVMKRISNYTKSTAEWIKAGRPTRSDEEVAKIFAICKSNTCNEYHEISKDISMCKSCGCLLNQHGGLVNKIRRATEHCPLGHW